MASCYHCGAALEPPIHRSTLCPSCGKDAKVCRNCAFYAPGMKNDCREPSAEGVKEKDRANFCGYFRLRTEDAPAGGSSGKDRSEEARSAFDSLFGG